MALVQLIASVHLPQLACWLYSPINVLNLRVTGWVMIDTDLHPHSGQEQEGMGLYGFHLSFSWESKICT